MANAAAKHTHSGHAGMQHPLYFRSWDLNGTVINIDFLSAESQGGTVMEGLPERTPPGVLYILNIQSTPQVIVLRGEDDVSFEFVVPGDDGAAGSGHLERLPGGINSVVATGSGVIDRLIAGWYQSGSPMRHKIGA